MKYVGLVTLTCTKTNVSLMFGFMFLKFKKRIKNSKWILHNVIFNVLVYIFKKLEINLMNEKYPKAF
jgi:hypothetical protein